jgi:hypothetical protein
MNPVPIERRLSWPNRRSERLEQASAVYGTRAKRGTQNDFQRHPEWIEIHQLWSHKNWIFNSTEAFDNFIIKLQNNVFITLMLQNIVFIFVPIHTKILDNQQRTEQLFNVLETY